MFTDASFAAPDALPIGPFDGPDTRRDRVMSVASTIANNRHIAIAASKFIIDMVSSRAEGVDEDACCARKARFFGSAYYPQATAASAEKRLPRFMGQ